MLRAILNLVCACAALSRRVETDQAFHPSIGQCVETLSSGQRSSDTKPIGTQGTFVRDAGSDVPFQVEFVDGHQGWYTGRELAPCPAKLKVGDQVLARPGDSHKDCYQSGDVGVVSKEVDGIYSITWQRTGKTTKIRAAHSRRYMRLDEELVGGVVIGDRVVSKIDFDGKNEGEHLRKGDVGVITGPAAWENRVKADFPNFKKVSLAPHHFTKEQATRAQADTQESSWLPGTGYVRKSAGEACTGGWFFDQYTGTCTGPGWAIKCYSNDDRSLYAASGAPGICLVTHQKECEQRIPGDGTSGSCQAGTTCRKFRFWQQTGSARLGDLDMGIDAKEEVESFCVKPDDDADNRLVFLNAFGYHGVAITVSERVYKTD